MPSGIPLKAYYARAPRSVIIKSNLLHCISCPKFIISSECHIHYQDRKIITSSFSTSIVQSRVRRNAGMYSSNPMCRLAMPSVRNTICISLRLHRPGRMPYLNSARFRLHCCGSHYEGISIDYRVIRS